MAITYTPATNFGAKDSLPTNDPDKVIKGSEFTTEFTAIQTAFGLAAPAASPTFTGTVTIASVDINGGNIDGTVIGGATPAAGSFTTGSFSGNVSFADNAKAIFGAGSDLQIYHDGTDSIINEGTAGNLLIQGATIKLQTANGAKDYLVASPSAEITLYHNNAAKLATTATGIDVTGTVTADSLTVDGAGTLTGSTDGVPVLTLSGNNDGVTAKNTLRFFDSDFSAQNQQTGRIEFYGNDSFGAGVNAYIEVKQSPTNSGTLAIGTGEGGVTPTRLQINPTGDISFYEDTGTTPKFFWDASAESLGIGTTSPSAKLHVNGGDGNNIRYEGATHTVAMGMTGADPFVGSLTNGPLRFLINASERARFDTSGNLRVGTTVSVITAGERAAFVGPAGITAQSTGGATSHAGSFWNNAVSGDNLLLSFYTDGGTLRGSIDYNRSGGLTRYNTTSDYRAKDILGPVENAGATIDALKVYEGVMKGATQSRPMLIAHEAQEQAPYAVSGTKDAVNEDGTPDYQKIDHSSLVPLLIAEIQSLRARVAQLEGA